MNAQAITETQSKLIAPAVFYPSDIPDEILYPSEVGEEMGETAIHFKQIALLFGWLELFFESRKDVLIAADLVVYYEESQPQMWYAPDVFVCFGVEKGLRRTFKSWQEKAFPQIVFEVASSSTAESDLGKKYLEYARLGVEEYYLLDPEREYLPAPLIAYHRHKGRLTAAKIKNNAVLSPRLGLEIVDAGEMFRLLNPTTNKFLLTLKEAEAEAEAARAEVEQLKAQLKKLKGEN